MKVKALDRSDRKRQILLAFAMNIGNGGSGEMTVAGVAQLMHLTASSKLREMMLELVIDGSLDFRDEPIPGVAKFRRIYSPNVETFKRPTPQYQRQGRAIKISGKQTSFIADVEW